MKSAPTCVLAINGGSSSIRFARYETGDALRRRLQAKLIEPKAAIDQNSRDLPEIRNWQWAVTQPVRPLCGVAELGDRMTAGALFAFENQTAKPEKS